MNYNHSMKLFTFALFFFALPCVYCADTASDNPPSVSFAKFPLASARAHVSKKPGTPASKAKLDDPFPNDYPPATTIVFEDTRNYPALEKGARYFFPGQNVLRVYRISNVQTAPYKTIRGDITSLRKVLAERPHIARNDAEHPLPDYPPRNAAHAFEVKLTYIDAAWGSGICYATQFTQDGGTPANNEELTYIVQGITKDNNFYISGDFRITNPKLPKGIDDAPRRRKGDYEPDRRLLSKEADSSFTPSLAKVRDWIKSLKVE
jgi:hypothetical protein